MSRVRVRSEMGNTYFKRVGLVWIARALGLLVASLAFGILGAWLAFETDGEYSSNWFSPLFVFIGLFAIAAAVWSAIVGVVYLVSGHSDEGDRTR